MNKHIKYIFILSFLLLSIDAPAQSTSSFSSQLNDVSEASFIALDSALTLWQELYADVVKDLDLLPDSLRPTAESLANALNARFASFHSVQRGQIQRAHSEFQSLFQKNSQDSQSVVMRAKQDLQRRNAIVADTILALQDSLSAFVESLFIAQSDKRSLLTSDYKEILNRAVFAEEPTHQFDVGFSFQSRSVWRGIEQNNGQGSYGFSATYQHRLGFFGSLQGLGLQGQGKRIDQFTFNFGFQRQWSENFTTSIAYSRYRYDDSSAQVRSSINSDLSLWLSYDTPFFTPSISLGWLFADENTDFICSWEVSRGFSFPSFLSGELLLLPGISAEYGTLTSTQIRVGRNRAGQIRNDISTSSAFVITNYNFSFTAIYSLHGFSIIPELIYTIPINVESVSQITRFNPNLPAQQQTLSLEAKSFVYFSFSFIYTL